MKRRQFLLALGGAAAIVSSLPASAQPATPVIGYLDPTSPEGFAEGVRAFREGLKSAGFVEGENITIDYRWADNQLDRLPQLAADLVRRRVAVIAAIGPAATLAAKAETATIPIVFGIAADPVSLDLVASLARPGGNLTGFSFINAQLTGKRLEILRELVPAAKRMAVLANPEGTNLDQDMQQAASAMRLQIQVLKASTSREIDAAFAAIARDRPDALFVNPNPLFGSRRMQITHLATRHAIPAIYALREYVDAGGLISYGASRTDATRQIGAYAGRILKGTLPADLPVMQSTKFELVINLQTARILGLAVPSSLLTRADDVIE